MLCLTSSLVCRTQGPECSGCGCQPGSWLLTQRRHPRQQLEELCRHARSVQNAGRRTGKVSWSWAGSDCSQLCGHRRSVESADWCTKKVGFSKQGGMQAGCSLAGDCWRLLRQFELRWICLGVCDSTDWMFSCYVRICGCQVHMCGQRTIKIPDVLLCLRRIVHDYEGGQRF